MDRLTLSRIDEELGSSEVAALCFLCLDFINKKRLEGIVDAKGLFRRLEEKGLENHCFLSELLHTIRRADLVKLLETDSRQLEETDANPTLSSYRVMLYRIYEEMTNENFEKMQFLLRSKLGRRPTEMCKSALELFVEMEKNGILSRSRLDSLHDTLLEMDRDLVAILNLYKEVMGQRLETSSGPLKMYPSLQGIGETVFPDAEAKPARDPDQRYPVNSCPTGLCVIINNEHFASLKQRLGTNKDAESLAEVFNWLGFRVLIFTDQTKDEMDQTMRYFASQTDDSQLPEFNAKEWTNHRSVDIQAAPTHGDAFVCCILSHGEKGVVFGTDGEPLTINHTVDRFKASNQPALSGKPKVFFIQACQGRQKQGGVLLENLQSDDGPSLSIPKEADFLIAIATVEDYASFRHTINGTWFIQSLCQQLKEGCTRGDGLTAILERVNNDVSSKEGTSRPGEQKQMPEVRYTLRKSLVFSPCH